MRIVLLGKTGAGKSATGNTILGNKLFTSQVSTASVTEKCCSESNPTVRVIDTPGFFDTTMSNREVTEEIVKCIGLSCPGAHAFIIVVKIGRFTKEEAETVNLIKAQFGQEILRYMVVLFTGMDDLEEEGTSIEKYLENDKGDLNRLLSECGNKYICFNNRAGPEKKIKQSCELIKLVDNIVESNDGKYYTSELYLAVRKCIEEEVQKRIRVLEEEMDKKIEALRQDNQLTKKQYEEMVLELEQKCDNKKHDIDEAIRQDLQKGTYTCAAFGRRLDKYFQHGKAKCSIM